MAADEAQNESIATVNKVSDLGRYRLIAELARGGMGVVYLALVRGPGGFNKLFVIKELKPHLAEDPNLVRMFLEEARLAAKLSHPNVVQTMEVGSEGNRHFIAMEYLDGQPLNRAIARTRKAAQGLPYHYSLFAISHMLEGLEYAHSATDFDGSPMNVVHRDVSPHNVFITYDGQVKVLDFGIAKALGSSSDTRTGMLKGKIAYMAPEQAAGQPIDRRADVFSAGVMLFEATTGARFWNHAQNDLQILHALTSGAITKPRAIKADIDPAVERIILRATAVDPTERYASAAEMQSDVEGYMGRLEVPPFGARDIGKFFVETFATDRARIKGVIDNQLRTLHGTVSGEYGKVDLPQLASVPAPSGTPSAMLLARRELDAAVQTPDRISQIQTPAEGLYRAALGVDSSLPPPSPTGKARLMAATVIGAALFIAAAAVLALKHFPSRAPAPVASAVAVQAAHVSATPLGSLSRAPSAPASTPKTAEPIHVVVVASPRNAAVTIDDGTPQTGTFKGTFPRDSAAHTIRIEAQKYEPLFQQFRADADHTFELVLEPAKEHASRHGNPLTTNPPPEATVESPPTPATPPPPPQPTSHARQQIDTRDPYSQ